MLLNVTVKSATVTVDTLQLDALKRFVIFDPLFVKVAILEARKLAASGQTPPTIPGLDLPTLCTNVSEDQVAAIFAFLDARQPNQPPAYTSLEYARRRLGIETATVALGIDEILALAPGEELVMRGRATRPTRRRSRSSTTTVSSRRSTRRSLGHH